MRSTTKSRPARTQRARGRRLQRSPLAAAGLYIKSRLPRGRPRSLALDASLRAAAGRSAAGGSGGGLRVTPPDIREKMRLQPTAAAILFLVDASGSMGANARMTLTKGIIFSLLTDAYRKRDLIALLAFRATQTELLLPFTKSPLVAQARLRRLAVGGKTPLGLGLKEAIGLLEAQARKNRQLRPVLVVVSDGKGNVALEFKDPYDEAMYYAREVGRRSIEAVFVDTEESPCSFGYGRQVARAMGAHYLTAERVRQRGVIELPF